MFRRGTKATATAADAERQALFEQLAQRPESVCPFLGLGSARAEFQEQATDDHRCFAFGDPEPISSDQQRNVCLQRGYANCPRYLRGVLVIPTDELEALRRPPQRVPPPPPPTTAPVGQGDGGRRRGILVVLLLLLLIGGGVSAWWMLSGPGAVAESPTPTPSADAPTPSPTVAAPSPTASDGASATPSSVVAINGTGQFSLLGGTTRDGDALRLTTTALDQAGAAWYPDPVAVADGFTAEFSYQVGAITAGGGDGLAFVIQSEGASALGSAGEGIGYAGLPNSLALELDTFLNEWPGIDDPNANHVSLHTAGAGANTADHVGSIASATAIPDLSDGLVHVIRVVYLPGSFAVSIDGNLVVSVDVDLAETLALLRGGTAYVGFTAATGSASQVNSVFSVGISFP
jgi:hypothetical protein